MTCLRANAPSSHLSPLYIYYCVITPRPPRYNLANVFLENCPIETPILVVTNQLSVPNSRNLALLLLKKKLNYSIPNFLVGWF